MTIVELFSEFHKLRPEWVVNDEELLQYLNEIEGRIKKEIIDRHEGGEQINYVPYTTSSEIVLLAKAPYDRLYLHYLEARADYTIGDTTRYHNSYAMFNEAFEAFAKQYNRTVMPKRTRINYF